MGKSIRNQEKYSRFGIFVDFFGMLLIFILCSLFLYKRIQTGLDYGG